MERMCLEETGDRTLDMNQALVPPPSLPQSTCTHVASGTPSRLDFSPNLAFSVRVRTSAQSCLVPGQHWPFHLFWLPNMGNILVLGRISSARISQTHPSSQRRAAEKGRSRRDMRSP